MAGKVKGLLFDKDGTLLDYDKTWLPINRIVAATLSRGDAALAASLLGLFDPPTDRQDAGPLQEAGTAHDARGSGDSGDRASGNQDLGDTPPGALVIAGSQALQRIAEEVDVLPVLVWVEASGHPRLRIAPPIPLEMAGGTGDAPADLARLLDPFAELLEEHPDVWPWHRLGPPPLLAPDR